MIFNSIEYFIFLPIVLFFYFRANFKQQNILLLLASYIFYGWWDPRFLFLITLSTTIDFYCGILLDRGRLSFKEIQKGILFLFIACLLFIGVFGRGGENSWEVFILGFSITITIVIAVLFQSKLSKLHQEKRKKIIIGISVVANLGILGVFKYFNFFVDSAQALLTSIGISESSLIYLDIILPVGISFYTFQTMSYTLDIYRGKLKSCDNITDFALFVSYFPQLVAGPIERASDLLPRIINKREVTWDHVYEGLGLISYGLFKKVVIADGVAASVASVYGTTGTVSWFDVFAATFLFAIQIYCDFSGYSDIARGTSKLLGIDLMRNFNFPYFSRGPSEFWRRWHISLSSWLRDYLYISLGGNRGGEFKTLRNLMLTMMLGGLWHGAAWNFVIWGIYQGSLLVTYRLFSLKVKSIENQPVSVVSFTFSVSFFFLLTLYGWLLFRAESFGQILNFTSLLFSDFGNFSISMKFPPFATLLSFPVFLLFETYGYMKDRDHVILKRYNLYEPYRTVAKATLFGFMILIFLAALSTPPASFIYFQF